MMEFFGVLSKVIYIFFIVSSVLFGLSVAIKFYVMKVAKNIVDESDKNYDKIGDYCLSDKCDKIIKQHALRYDEFAQTEKKNLKIKKQNKVRKFFGLKERSSIEQTDSLKSISLSLFIEISNCFDCSGGYLNYSKNEIISILKVFIERLNSIFRSSNVIWLKIIKISTLAHIISATKSIEQFKNKTSVIIISAILEFAFSISKILSPVSAGKLLAKNLISSSFSSLLISSTFAVVGKEWAVLCYQKQVLRQGKSGGKKVA